MQIKHLIIKTHNNIIYFFVASIVFIANLAVATEENQIEIQQNKGIYYKYALVRGLNKITNKSLVLKVLVGDELHYFDKLAFFVKKCWKVLENNRQESKVLIDVWCKDNNSNTERMFFGWMLSFSPSISSLEHQIYDLSLVECTD